MNPHSFLEPHSRAIRVWHWTFVLFVSATIGIVILASTIFRTGNNVAVVEHELAIKNIPITENQARAAAHEFNDQLWDIHRWLGIGLCVLIFTRWLIEKTLPHEERLNYRVRKAANNRSTILIEQEQRRHYLRVKSAYLVFYGLFAATALSGLVLALDDIPRLDEYRQTARQIHAFLQWPVYAFIIIHLIGVIRADLGQHRGLVSGMIHGHGQRIID
ncbi:MAG TPA: cytochrome b/b6 domain-containing protein [Puia sp.]|nr:cytochrome b/b6 domain-containing protein [Puia sp.]